MREGNGAGNGNGADNGNGASNGNGSRPGQVCATADGLNASAEAASPAVEPPPVLNAAGQRATARQMEYARVLAGQIRGLGQRRLETFGQALLGKPLADLTPLEASRLIDMLKDVRAGKLDLEIVLRQASP